MYSTIANIERQNEKAVSREGDFLSGGENFFDETAIFRSPFYSETKTPFNKSSNAQGVLPLLRKVDAAHYQCPSLTTISCRSSTLAKLYRVFLRH